MIYSPKQLSLRKLLAYADPIPTADPEAPAILATENREGVRRFHRFFLPWCEPPRIRVLSMLPHNGRRRYLHEGDF